MLYVHTKYDAPTRTRQSIITTELAERVNRMKRFFAGIMKNGSIDFINRMLQST